MAQCNKCQTTNEDLNYFWHGDIEEDYDMGDYDCLCENCFNQSKWIVWVGGVDDYFFTHTQARRYANIMIDKGYDDVYLEKVK